MIISNNFTNFAVAIDYIQYIYGYFSNRTFIQRSRELARAS